MNSAHYIHTVAIESCGATGQDRAVVVHSETSIIIALADGAGGTGNGAAAADLVVNSVMQNPAACADAASLLYALDANERLDGGQTTAVVLVIEGTRAMGASVGDSGAWVIDRESIVDLTQGQRRKPLLGDGCSPVAFSGTALPGSTLVVASDGLFRYAKPRDIVRIVSQADIETAARQLIELVRLPSGGLQDDVSVVLCRHG